MKQKLIIFVLLAVFCFSNAPKIRGITCDDGISGFVKDRETQEPIEGAEVSVSIDEEKDTLLSVLAREDGSFSSDIIAANITCNSGKGVQTALGCVPTDPMALVKWIFPYLLGIGGTIAFFMLIIGGFQIMTSGGDPEKIKAGKEQITAAISGLLFIVFSLFILRLIGVDILGLPGLE